ncbi:hypothetical protein [Actinopolymorpha alba]|uniref:hypothetical protein n=1 Tax=Actinopolymorpha alba TaxID=533267 RepID=UPI00035D8369|nr:hypothetical protein [Actinopolymorpha alba]
MSKAVSLAPAGSHGTRATRVLQAILASSFVLSVVHYADNYLRFDRYALRPDGLVTQPIMIVLGWVIFTVIGAVGYLMYVQRRWWPAVVLFAVYSVTGLISALHYTEGPLSAFDPLQHVLIVTDLVAGLAVLGSALWLMFARAVPELSD